MSETGKLISERFAEEWERWNRNATEADGEAIGRAIVARAEQLPGHSPEMLDAIRGLQLALLLRVLDERLGRG